jgi:chromosome segregation ATPase
MAKVGAQRAAELTGKSKSTIQRSMKNGKISFELDSHKRRVIDVAELERVFGLVPQESDMEQQKNVEAEIEKATQMLDMERLKMRVKLLEEQLDTARESIEDLKTQRDQWQKQAQQVLLTSEYSQKQAEELKQELKARENREIMRRKQMMEQRTKRAQSSEQTKTQAHNENRAPSENDQDRVSNIQSLWSRFKGADKQKKAG